MDIMPRGCKFPVLLIGGKRGVCLTIDDKVVMYMSFSVCRRWFLDPKIEEKVANDDHLLHSEACVQTWETRKTEVLSIDEISRAITSVVLISIPGKEHARHPPRMFYIHRVEGDMVYGYRINDDATDNKDKYIGEQEIPLKNGMQMIVLFEKLPVMAVDVRNELPEDTAARDSVKSLIKMEALCQWMQRDDDDCIGYGVRQVSIASYASAQEYFAFPVKLSAWLEYLYNTAFDGQPEKRKAFKHAARVVVTQMMTRDSLVYRSNTLVHIIRAIVQEINAPVDV